MRISTDLKSDAEYKNISEEDEVDEDPVITAVNSALG